MTTSRRRVLRGLPSLLLLLLVGAIVASGWSAPISSATTSPSDPGGDRERGGAGAHHTVPSTASAPSRVALIEPTQWRARRNGRSVLIDLQGARVVTGLQYAPGKGSAPRQRLRQFRLQASLDAQSWTTVSSGTWAEDATTKTTVFAPITAHYLRLSDTGPDAQTVIPTSAPSLQVIAGSGAQVRAALAPSFKGRWGATLNFPLVPSSVALLPGNKVLMWAAFSADDYPRGDLPDEGYTQTAILDLSTGAVSARTITHTRHDMFCPGVAILPDGRIMVSGGANARRTSIYDARTDTWTTGPEMTMGRGYHAMTPLAGGGVFTIGGSWSGGRGGKSAEFWTPTAGWTALPGISSEAIMTDDPKGAFRADNHAWLSQLSRGRILHSGPSKNMHWVSLKRRGALVPIGTRADAPDAMNGNAVLYDVDRILTLGGAPAYDPSPATNRAYEIDARTNTPVTTRVGDMAEPRTLANAVVLPTGQVLVTGGQSYADLFQDTTATLAPEIWSPSTGAFTALAPAPTPRTYHSVGLLLPDGRVLSAGGGQCGPTCTTNHLDGQIFSPPYLFKSDGTTRYRPRITSAPTRAARGSTISVTTQRAVVSFALVRYGEATHTVNNDQRRVPLSIGSSNGTTYQMRLPSDPGVLVPGPYLLFAIDAVGTPSVAKTVFVP